jgi:hypothetical protein
MPDQAPRTRLPKLDDHVQAVGSVALLWSNLDLRMNNAIWQLANIAPSAGACLTSQFLASGQRLQCLMALLKLRHAPKVLIDEFNSLAGEIESAGRKRNKLLQEGLESFTAEDIDVPIDTIPEGPLRAPSRRNIAAEPTDWTNLAVTISDLIQRFDDIHSRIVARLRPWPRIQFKPSLEQRAQRRIGSI